jgi:glycosyltransferase involved in cell wall biosynthesis
VLFVCRFALGHSNARTVFQNPDDQMIFTKQGIVDEQLTRVIRGSGVDMSQFVHLPEMPGIPLVILCARMLWSKGVRIFVEAARALRDTGVKARFALIGDTDIGNPAAIARFELEAWRDEGVVEWWGHCDGMPEIFKQCHIVCLPSAYGEGVPKVLIEAAASGRAIVATAIPGCGEIVRDGVNGLLVPVHDSVRLADALQRLIENPQLRRQMGAQGRAMAEAEFSIEKVVGETLEIYNQLLSRNPH